MPHKVEIYKKKRKKKTHAVRYASRLQILHLFLISLFFNFLSEFFPKNEKKRF
jgi:hypothetical protein